MNIGYNSGYNQLASLSLAGGAQPTPYSPSYSLPIQPTGNMPTMQQDNYESTRDKSFGDFAGGFVTGAGKAIYDMGHGVVFLGKMAGKAIGSPIQSLKWAGGAAVHAVTHPLQTAEAVVTAPFKIAKGIVKPYSQALQQGRYGEAMGRLTVDITVLAAALGEKSATPAEPTPAVEPPPVVDPPPVIEPPITPKTPVTPVGGGGSASNNITNNIGDVKDALKDLINNTGGTINGDINIGDIIIGGQKGTNMTASTSGVVGAAAATEGVGTVGNIVGGADEAAKVVSSGATYTAEASSTLSSAADVIADTGQAVNASRTFGQSVGAGIDIIIDAPGKVFRGIGTGFDKVGNAIKKVGHVLANPKDLLTGINPVNTAEWISNGLKTGAGLVGDGLVFAAKNPKQALIITGAVGRGGKAAEDILMEFDLVR